MARANIRTDLGGGRYQYSYIDLPDAPRPTGPSEPLTPMGTLFALLCLLGGFAMVVMFVLAANAPNPGDADYQRPGTTTTTEGN